jgi:hypothetical protein
LLQVERRPAHNLRRQICAGTSAVREPTMLLDESGQEDKMGT